MRSSSALATRTADGPAPSRISALASAIASSDAKKPRWASPTLVQTRTSGSATRTSVLISPAWFMPSSTTAISGRRLSSMSESGSPMWLLKFPLLRTTRYRAARNSAVISFVVVFPALPVMATTFAPDSIRTRRATCWSAAVVSSTSMTTARGSRTSPPRPRGTTTPAAPAATAAGAKSAPSNRSPRIPTYSSPGASVRVSIDTPLNARSSSPATIAPAGRRGHPSSGQRDVGHAVQPAPAGSSRTRPTRRPNSSAGARAPRAPPPRRRTAARGRR